MDLIFLWPAPSVNHSQSHVHHRTACLVRVNLNRKGCLAQSGPTRVSFPGGWIGLRERLVSASACGSN